MSVCVESWGQAVGQAKHSQMHYEERGFGPIEGATCVDHVHDPYLAAWVQEEANELCTFCGSSDAMSLETLTELVVQTIVAYYEPADQQPWHSGSDSWEVLEEVAGGDFDDEVLERMAQALMAEGQMWARRSEHTGPGDEWLGAGWPEFCRWITTRSRFLLEPSSEDWYERAEQPQNMLAEIGRLVLEENLIIPLPVGTLVYRARALSEDTELDKAADLVAPPRSLATAGRMNPPGISMFYGAMDPDTAAVEVYDGNRKAALARFRTLSDLLVLDLLHLPQPPSIYDLEHLRRRRRLLFLAEFADEISRPIDRDGDQGLRYLPSQAVTEYFRLAVPEIVGHALHGVLYRSSRVEPHMGSGSSHAGANIVLFCGPDGALERSQLPNALRSEPQLLEMLDGSYTEVLFGAPPVHQGRRVGVPPEPSTPGSV
jgi:hypothetical protein